MLLEEIPENTKLTLFVLHQMKIFLISFFIEFFQQYWQNIFCSSFSTNAQFYCYHFLLWFVLIVHLYLTVIERLTRFSNYAMSQKWEI